MSIPSFSIAIPAFKKTFLRECIQSVLDQTCPDFELIIINDNSPENLDESILSFSDPRIIYRKNAIGFGAIDISKNWNECLKLANGTYFICMGDDDKLLPDCLEKYLSLTNTYPDYHLYHAGTQLINEQSIVVDLQESRPVKESVYSMIWHRWYRGRKSYIGDFMFHTEALKQMGGFLWTPYAWGSDEQTIYTLASDRGIINMQGFGFQYRVNTQSISGSSSLYIAKAEAWRLGKAWYSEFLNKKPSNSQDVQYWQFLQKGLDWYFSDCFLTMVKGDFRDNRLKNYRYWMKHRQQYGLSRKDILFYLLLGLKQRFHK